MSSQHAPFSLMVALVLTMSIGCPDEADDTTPSSADVGDMESADGQVSEPDAVSDLEVDNSTNVTDVESDSSADISTDNTEDTGSDQSADTQVTMDLDVTEELDVVADLDATAEPDALTDASALTDLDMSGLDLETGDDVLADGEDGADTQGDGGFEVDCDAICAAMVDCGAPFTVEQCLPGCLEPEEPEWLDVAICVSEAESCPAIEICLESVIERPRLIDIDLTGDNEGDNWTVSVYANQLVGGYDFASLTVSVAEVGLPFVEENDLWFDEGTTRVYSALIGGAYDPGDTIAVSLNHDTLGAKVVTLTVASDLTSYETVPELETWAGNLRDGMSENDGLTVTWTKPAFVYDCKVGVWSYDSTQMDRLLYFDHAEERSEGETLTLPDDLTDERWADVLSELAGTQNIGIFTIGCHWEDRDVWGEEVPIKLMNQSEVHYTRFGTVGLYSCECRCSCSTGDVFDSTGTTFGDWILCADHCTDDCGADGYDSSTGICTGPFQ